MNQQTARPADDGANRSIEILAVVTPKRAAEVQRVLSHTRWRTHIVPSIQKAMEALRSRPVSVVLCEETFSDGDWLNVVRETERLSPRPQTIVLSARADATLWGEVLNRGGYDLLPMPLDPHEVYAIIPMAWRQCAGTAETSTGSAAVKVIPEFAKVS
jgi:DNA-binding NtrC family response regulator